MTTIRIGNVDDIDGIVSCTNDAFMADAFFKKPEFHLRFTRDDVVQMIAENNAVFIVATSNSSSTDNTSKTDGEIVGSLYLNWKMINESKLCKIDGKFSAVSVPSKHANQGIGKMLVQAAEEYLCQNVTLSLNKKNHDTNAAESMKSSSLSSSAENPNNVFFLNTSATTTPPVAPSPLLQYHITLAMGVINLRTDLFPWYEKQGYHVIGEIKPNDAEITRIVLEALKEKIWCVLMSKELNW